VPDHDKARDLAREIRQLRASLAKTQALIDGKTLALLRIYAGERTPAALAPSRPTVDGVTAALSGRWAKEKGGLTRQEIADELEIADLDALSRLLNYMRGHDTKPVFRDPETKRWRLSGP
jgi:hypothetical protein